MITFLLHVALAVVLFYLINWIGRHSSGLGYMQLTLFVRPDEAPAFNFLLRAVAPAVYVILAAAVLYTARLDQIVGHIWRVAAYYYFFRLAYNVALGRALLMNWALFLFQAAFGTLAAYLAYKQLILPKQPLFPDVTTVGNELWIAIALFIYATLNNVRTSSGASARRKNRYLADRVAELRRSYSSLIVGQFSKRYLELVVYAILIHENFNRPPAIRWLERAVFPLWSRTLGVMQVQTNRRISDAESVAMGVAQLRRLFEQTQAELEPADHLLPEGILLQRIVAKYNRDDAYVAAVSELARTLALQVATEYRVDYERLWLHPDTRDERSNTGLEPSARG